MATYQGYKVTSNHKNGLYPAHVRVKSPDGVTVARVDGHRADVLRTIRYDMFCCERRQFIKQLRECGVPDDVIKAILAVPKEKL